MSGIEARNRGPPKKYEWDDSREIRNFEEREHEIARTEFIYVVSSGVDLKFHPSVIVKCL